MMGRGSDCFPKSKREKNQKRRVTEEREKMRNRK